MVFCGILALSIIIANITIIVVILQNPQFPTNQLIYKLSLAFADVLVGIFVVPSFITSLFYINVSPYQKNEMKNNFTDLDNFLFDAIDVFSSNPNTFYAPTIKKPYRDFFGFITSVSLFNSIFTLMFASIDRFNALHNSFTYNKDKATTYAKFITVGLWIVSIVFALLPIVVPELGPYEIVAGDILITVSNEISFYVLVSALAIPFFVMWIFTISVEVDVFRQLKVRKELTTGRHRYNYAAERKLSKTLSIMIGVFSACILPAVILLLIPEFVASINSYKVEQFNKTLANAFQSIELAAAIILSSNSLWNAFIYTFRNKEYRKNTAELYFRIASGLGLVFLKKSVLGCLNKPADDNHDAASPKSPETSILQEIMHSHATNNLQI